MPRDHRATPGVVGVVAAIVAALVASCSGASVLDTDAVERTLEDQVQVPEEVGVGRAECPAEVERRAGARFECTVEVADQPLEVTVEQLDDDGTVRLEPRQTVLVKREVEAEVAARVAAEVGGDADARPPEQYVATCEGPSAYVVVPGDRLACQVARGPVAARPVTVEVGEGGALRIFPA